MFLPTKLRAEGVICSTDAPHEEAGEDDQYAAKVQLLERGNNEYTEDYGDGRGLRPP